ncbi:hypothetical protein L3X38_004477 [Prunus dulcis]|uniref:Reverse transcriptase/retrotransposon-derived protein RNase H-like domain-containing protein n=1 Tax=Prunus dulcis TaxID=3755 RepID=A0AAD5F354_PRUDU|nr:hypothetical protein L3X38_004477 [Prunus dulcis]
MLGEEPLKSERTRVKKKGENNQNMVEETRGEPHMKESGPKAEEDQVMVEAEANGIEQETGCSCRYGGYGQRLLGLNHEEIEEGAGRTNPDLDNAGPFSSLLKPKDEEKFCWEETHQRAFNIIKKCLAKPPVLIPPRRGRPLKFYILASENSIGSLLAQDNDKRKGQVAYYLSRILTATEMKYSPVQKLFLAFQRLGNRCDWPNPSKVIKGPQVHLGGHRFFHKMGGGRPTQEGHPGRGDRIYREDYYPPILLVHYVRPRNDFYGRSCPSRCEELRGTILFALIYGHNVILPLEISTKSLRVARHAEWSKDEYDQAMAQELDDLDEVRLGALDKLKPQKEAVV